MTQVATTIGSPRVVSGISVLHPTGNPALDPEAEQGVRRTVVLKALKAVAATS